MHIDFYHSLYLVKLNKQKVGTAGFVIIRLFLGNALFTECGNYAEY